MKLKWYGTATIMLELDGTRLLFDPFLSLNEKLYKPPMDELAAAQHILITHGHLDHVVDVPALLRHGGGKAMAYYTETPRAALLSKGVEEGRLKLIAPGDVLGLGPFELRVLKGRHIVFDRRLLLKTLVSPRIFAHWKNFRRIWKENKDFDEAGETVAYEICASGRRILLLGSLNLDEGTEYPEGADLLILPLQGRSDICEYAMPFIALLRPRKVLLTHFDDTFPPVSSSIDPGPFLSLMRQQYPAIPVMRLEAGGDWVEV